MSNTQECYELGNQLYTEKKFERAFEIYSQGLNHVQFPQCLMTKEESTLLPLHTKLLSNRSVCALHLRMYDVVVEDCSMVLERDEKNVKSLLRRCKALEYKGEFKKALSDCERLLSIHSIPSESETHSATFISNLIKVRRRLEQLIKQDAMALSQVMNNGGFNELCPSALCITPHHLSPLSSLLSPLSSLLSTLSSPLSTSGKP